MRINLSALLSGLILISFPVNGPATTLETERLQILRADYSTLLKAKADFERSRARGELSNAEVTDYADWIHQLDDQFIRDCFALKRISSAPLPDDLPCDQMASNGSGPADLDLASESTIAENTSRIIEQLNTTLGDFDESLLREQDRIRAQRPRTDSTSQASSEGTGGTEAGHENDADAPEGTTAETGDEGQLAQNRAGAGNAEENTSDQTSSGQPVEKSGTRRQGAPGKSMPGVNKDVPDDIPDGSDDDVVARQLREAAEKESDPELKKKLWEEYRRYKTGTT